MSDFNDVGASVLMAACTVIIVGFSIFLGTSLKDDKGGDYNLAALAIMATVFGTSLFIVAVSHLIYGR